MTSPIVRSVSAPLPNSVKLSGELPGSVQESVKCDICAVEKITHMIFYSVYGKHFNFCSRECLKKWVITDVNK